MKKTIILASVLALSTLMFSCNSNKTDNTEEAIENEIVMDEPAEDPEITAIESYLDANNLTAEANAEGIYIIVQKQGNGPKVEMGKTVKMNYTGSLLSGKVFDTSVKRVAEDNHIFDINRKYEPLEYVVGQASLIKGWDHGVMGQAEGTVLKLIFPSTLGYGAQNVGDLIPANSPLTFDIEIVSVK